MRLICPSCQASYDVPDGMLGPDGRHVQCTSCHTRWFERPPSQTARGAVAEDEILARLEKRRAGPRPVPAAAPARVPAEAGALPGAEAEDRDEAWEEPEAPHAVAPWEEPEGPDADAHREKSKAPDEVGGKDGAAAVPHLRLVAPAEVVPLEPAARGQKTEDTAAAEEPAVPAPRARPEQAREKPPEASRGRTTVLLITLAVAALAVGAYLVAGP